MLIKKNGMQNIIAVIALIMSVTWLTAYWYMNDRVAIDVYSSQGDGNPLLKSKFLISASDGRFSVEDVSETSYVSSIEDDKVYGAFWEGVKAGGSMSKGVINLSFREQRLVELREFSGLQFPDLSSENIMLSGAIDESEPLIGGNSKVYVSVSRANVWDIFDLAMWRK